MNLATSARENTIIAGEKEQIALALNSLSLDKITGKIDNIDEHNFEIELNSSGNNTQVDYVDNDSNKDFSVTFIDTTHEYIVDKNGNITLKGTNIVIPPTPVVLSSIKAWTINANTDFHKGSIRNAITEIQFVNYLPNPINLNEDNCWDVSQDNDQSVIAWLDGTKLYIGGNGGVKANEDSSYVFRNFSNLVSINFNNNYDTSDVINMSYMFANSTKLQSLDLSSFKTSKVEDMSAMFLGATGTTSNWGTQTNMALTEINLSSFDTRNVTNMNSMFGNCGNLVILDLRNFNTINVTNMAEMFNMPNDYSSKLETIILGEKFETTKVQNMKFMFYDNKNLKTIYASRDFDSSSIINSDRMFGYASKLTGGNGTKNNSNSISYAKIDKQGNPGYFTDIRQNTRENNQDVEYIESTGTQYIDAYTLPNNNTVIELDGIKYDDGSLYGVKSTFNATGISSNKAIVFDYNGTRYTSTIRWDDNQRHIFKQDKNLIYIDNVLINTFNTATFNSNYSIYLFARNASGDVGDQGRSRIYYVKIWNNDELIHHFIPVYNIITLSYGLYDKVEGKFYGNSGTGTFTPGPKKVSQ